MTSFSDLDRRAVTALRVLAIDQVEQARSGHPGMPLGAAPMAYVLWSRFLCHDPSRPDWPDRDRFVLSAGHGSALLYALLHLFGYDLPMDELRQFRQWGSRTPGHPEHGHTVGVETTTGPLGQGIANAVGMALAERHLASRFQAPGTPVVGHRTWVIAGDGDMMEGISHEAASLAGHLGLGRLVVLYDDNHITIEGPTELAWSEDVPARFASYGWRVVHVDDGNDLDAIAAGLEQAVADDDAPVLVRVRTHIGYGSPAKQDSAAAHGAPLGAEEAAATRAALGWDIEEPFVVPDDVVAHVRGTAARGADARTAWEGALEEYRSADAAAASELERRWRGDLPEGLDAVIPSFEPGDRLATRQASGTVLNAVAGTMPELIGGSADLGPSNNTAIKGETSIARGEWGGRNIHFGVREHAMGAIANGMSLHGGLRPYTGTFLVFADYMRPAVRLAALMGQPVVFVFTHDSVHLGEDGPTHQPVEHMVSLRIIPGMVALRPADANETAQAWQVALERRDGPTALVLSRQKLPTLPPPPAGAVARGGYVREEACGGIPRIVLLATGSEVSLALAVRGRLEQEGLPTRVVSVPSLELLARQDDAYRSHLLGPRWALRVSLELGRGQGWHKWIGDGEMIALSRFGASAPGDEVAAHLGFSVEAVTARIMDVVRRRCPRSLDIRVPLSLEGVIAGKLARLESIHGIGRFSIRDGSLWGDRAAGDAVSRLGWLDLPCRTRRELPALAAVAGRLAAEGVDTLVLVGMGGSSLSPKVLHDIYGEPSGHRLVVLDTTDPDHVNAVLRDLDVRKTAVLAVSKSGGTAETAALLEILWERFHRSLGSDAGERFIASTEHGTPLEQLASEREFRTLIPYPTDVGGRFAALSTVGVFPSLWLGHDVDALLRDADCSMGGLAPGHPAVQLATLLAAVVDGGFGILVCCSSPGLAAAESWIEQLVAESTGKSGRGILPVVTGHTPEALPVWGRSVYLSLRFDDEDVAELDRKLDEVAAGGHPVVRWRLRRDGLGGVFAVSELAVAMAGVFLGINPFDEPDVARAKERARSFLSSRGPALPTPADDPAALLLRHIDEAGPAVAAVLLAHLPETVEVEGALRQLARQLGARTGMPVTTAFGPRYLHSTGQLHKGGPRGIVPIVLTADPASDIAVPGRRFSLASLRSAQALGDAAALAEAHRPVLHLHLGTDPAAGLTALLAGTR